MGGEIMKESAAKKQPPRLEEIRAFRDSFLRAGLHNIQAIIG